MLYFQRRTAAPIESQHIWMMDRGNQMKTFTRLLAIRVLILTAGCGSNLIKLGKRWHLPEPTGPEDATKNINPLIHFGHNPPTSGK